MTPAASASFRDPENSAVQVDGTWYRIASPTSAAALDHFRSSSTYEELAGAGSIVRFDRVDDNRVASIRAIAEQVTGRPVPESATAYAVESIEVITYPWEWPNSLLQQAALLTLDLRSRLLDLGLDLKDASAFNVQFRGMQPVFIDLGSIETWRPNPSWNAARQFIEHFVNPLAVGSGDRVTAADAWELGRGRGLRSEVARSVMPRRQRRRLSLFLLQASTRPVPRNAPSETAFSQQATRDRGLALQATSGLTRRLRSQVEALTSRAHQTTWQDYGARQHYGSDDLERKASFARTFVGDRPGRAGLVLDVGGNDGFTGADLVREAGARVIVLDADAGALDVLHQGVSQAPDLARSITPLLGDITSLSPASGLLDQEFAAFTGRIRPTAVICQAVLHHVVITQGTPMPLAIEALARFGAPVQIEFATEDDEKVRILLSQIPNWTGTYSAEEFLRCMRARFRSVQEVGTTSPTRIVVNASND